MKLTVMGQIDSQDNAESISVSQCYSILSNLNKIGYIHLPTSYG